MWKTILNILTTFVCLLFIFYIWHGMMITLWGGIDTKYKWLGNLLTTSVYIVGGVVIMGIFFLIGYVWSL